MLALALALSFSQRSPSLLKPVPEPMPELKLSTQSLSNSQLRPGLIDVPKTINDYKENAVSYANTWMMVPPGLGCSPAARVRVSPLIFHSLSLSSHISVLPGSICNLGSLVALSGGCGGSRWTADHPHATLRCHTHW